jgi:monofunctional biosynthetic peptidoglycan transglycosylase
MEVYLNVIEMGPGIYGAESAAKHYYGIHAKSLNRRQAVSIAICLPNPLRYNPVKLSSYQMRRCNTLIQRMSQQ